MEWTITSRDSVISDVIQIQSLGVKRANFRNRTEVRGGLCFKPFSIASCLLYRHHTQSFLARSGEGNSWWFAFELNQSIAKLSPRGAECALAEVPDRMERGFERIRA